MKKIKLSISEARLLYESLHTLENKLTLCVFNKSSIKYIKAIPYNLLRERIRQKYNLCVDEDGYIVG